MVVALSVGMLTAAAAAAAVGAGLVRLAYGALDFDAVPLSKSPSVAYVTQAPPVFFSDRPLQIAVSLMWPVGVAALVYAVRVAADARDDLGALPRSARPPPRCPWEGAARRKRPCHSGRRRILRPVTTLAAILNSLAMPM